MAFDDNSEEYLPTLIDERGCMPLQTYRYLNAMFYNARQ